MLIIKDDGVFIYSKSKSQFEKIRGILLSPEGTEIIAKIRHVIRKNNEQKAQEKDAGK